MRRLTGRLGTTRKARAARILALFLPFALVPWLSGAVCRRVAHELAGWAVWIAWLAEPVPQASTIPRTGDGSADEEAAPPTDPRVQSIPRRDPAKDDAGSPISGQDPMADDARSLIASGSGRAGAAARGRLRRPARPAREAQSVMRPLGLEVSAEVVRSAIPPGARPSGVLVQANTAHPSGVEVQSPGILGAYIEPGDVVVEIEGQQIASWGALVGAVTRAYAHHAESVRGKLWRRGHDLAVTVHLPYDQTFTQPRGRGTK